MPIQKTNEFSVCLHPTLQIIQEVKEIRKRLAPSPYRDDPPHATLVRGIVADSDMNDTQLLNQIVAITHINKMLPLEGTITDVINKSNQFYSETSVLIITPSDELRQFRVDLLKSLTSQNFSDESSDKNTHPLHITVRLGVKLEDEMLSWIKERFLDTTVNFSSWSLFRLQLDDGARKMHEIKFSGE